MQLYAILSGTLVTIASLIATLPARADTAKATCTYRAYLVSWMRS